MKSSKVLVCLLISMTMVSGMASAEEKIRIAGAGGMISLLNRTGEGVYG